MSLTCLRNQLTESSENSKTTLEKGARNPPDVKLDFVLEDLLKYFNELEILCETKKEIENIYNIDKEHYDCWPEDDIKRAWGITQRIDDNRRRKHWALVIVMQVLKRQRTKEEDSEERSTQRKAKLEPLEAAVGDWQSSGGNHPTSSYLCQTSCASQATGNGAPDAQSGVLECVKNMIIEDETMYICIPHLEMFHNAPRAGDHSVPYVPSRYKLINGFPSDNTVNITRSYAMSFDNYTGNAEWVYEILNSETVVNNCDQISFGDDYHKGHLASVANHSWCQEAYNDTYLFSNIIPQNSKLNNSRWKALENRCRKMAKKNEICNVHVYTGPLYWRPMYQFVFDGRRKIVPTHLFKVIIVENKDGTVEKPKCYVMPNEKPKDEDWDKYDMDIEKFQRDSGLKLIEYRLNNRDRERDRIITVTLQGEDLNQTRHYVNIGVRITHNVNQ